MTESMRVELGPSGAARSLSVHAPEDPSLFFKDTSYLPHEIDWSYVNQESMPSPSQAGPEENSVHWAPSSNAHSEGGFWTKTPETLGIPSPIQPKGSASASLDRNDDSSLFSSSLPVLFKSQLTLSGSNSYAEAVHGMDDEVLGSMEEMESQTIGNLLPGDEDELLRDAFDVVPYSPEDFEDLDLFSSGGGLELEGDLHEYQSHGPAAGEHPYGEHPSRTLFVRNINSNVEDSELRSLFEAYGDIRTLYTACKHRGFVMIAYYDIRSARQAMRALQGKSLRRRKLDIHFSIPKDNPSDKDINQGTLVVFNLDASVANEDLRKIFGRYGEIKEIRETPHKRHHKFIEFYDVRAAEAALRALNRSDIGGKRIKLEPSRPGGARRSLIQQLSQEVDQDDGYSSQTAWTDSPPGYSSESRINTFEGDTVFASPKSSSYRSFSPRVNSHLQDVSSQLAEGHLGQSRQLRNHLMDQQGHPHSLPEYTVNEQLYKSSTGFGESGSFRHIEGFEARGLSRATSALNDGYLNGVHGTGSASLQRSSSLSASLTGQLWGCSPYTQGAKSSSLMWQNLSPRHSLNHRSGESLYSSSFSPHNHHFGSYTREPSADRHQSHQNYHQAEVSDLSPFMHSSIRMGPNTSQPMNGLMNDHGPSSPNFGMFLPPRLFGNGGLDDRRNRRMDNSAALQADNKKQFQLDLERIISGDDTRTTLMIKNIPNKYTSKMLLAAIDEFHRGTYDFIYLPIDFKNKCNVGYAFINMLSPSLIVPFYKTFNGKKWEKFNSEKVASLAYARIQGKAALIAHFQNSSLMNEDKRCRPIIFHSDGPNIGDQEPFPIGDNIRTRSSVRPEGYGPEDNFGGMINVE